MEKLLPHIPDTWIPFTDLDFNNQSINAFHIDTRDFHADCQEDADYIKEKIDFKTLSNYPERFYFTGEEIKLILKRLFQECGGSKQWRMLSFKENGGYWLKYIRIYRVNEKHFIMCDRENHATKKEFWNGTINKEA